MPDMPVQEIAFLDLSIDWSFGGTVLATLEEVRERIDRGFADVFEAWGEQVALPWIADQWPRASWPPLAASTLRRKARRGRTTPLIETGALFAAATERGAPGNVFEVAPDAIRLGVDSGSIPYALWQWGGTDRIPARPWDDLEGYPVQELVRMISDALWTGLQEVR